MLLTAFYLYLAAASLGVARGACRIRLDLDAPTSTLQLFGNNTVTRAGQTAHSTIGYGFFNKSIPRGFAGSLFAISDALSSCPSSSDRTSWIALLPTFLLASSIQPAQPQSLVAYPRQHIGLTGLAGLSGAPPLDYNITALELELQASSITVSYGNTSSSGTRLNFTADWNASISSGWLSSANVLTRQRNDSLTSLSGASSTVTGIMQIGMQCSRPQLALDIPSLPLSFLGTTVLEVLGLVFNARTNLTATARVVAKAFLDCPGYCGDHGSCGGLGAGGAPTCVCDCGWTADGSGQCNVRTGDTCPAAGEVSTPFPPPPPCPSPPPPLPPPPPPPPPPPSPPPPPPPPPAPPPPPQTTPAAIRRPPLAPPPPSPAPLPAAVSLLRLSLALLNIDATALSANVKAKNAIVDVLLSAATSITGSSASPSPQQSTLAVQIQAQVSSVASLPAPVPQPAATVSVSLSSGGQGGAAALRAAQDALQAALLSQQLQAQLRATGVKLLAKVKVRALAVLQQ